MNLVFRYRWYVAWMFWLACVLCYLMTKMGVPVQVAAVQKEPARVKLVELPTVSLAITFPSPPPMPSSDSTDVPVQNANSERSVSTHRKHQEQGRAWLSQLEQGEGPDIEIAWPENYRQRQWIQQRLFRCGVRLGKWHDGRLRAIEPNRYLGGNSQIISGFLRIIDGPMGADERVRLQVLSGIGQAVRLFPRRLDILLLGGFNRVAPDSFMRSKQVRGQYSREGSAVQVSHIRVDGRGYAEKITLLPASGGC